MEIKDKLVTWFVKNIEIPQVEIINKPGFIVTTFSEKKNLVFLREILFPERIFAEIEKRISKKFGKKGAKIIYAAGKEFGYRYSAISYFPQLKSGNEKQVQDFVYLFMRFIESIWSERVTNNIDFGSKTFQMDSKNFIVCNKSGLGHIIPNGIGTGFWSFIVDDETVEGYHLSCQGRDDELCKSVYAPAEVLKQRKLPYMKFIIKNTDELSKVTHSYLELNKIREPKFSTNSLKRMIDSEFIRYRNGGMYFNDERHFICEASLFYFVENELSKIPNAEKIVFDIAFEFGEDILPEKQDKKLENFISDYLSPCGWGDIMVFQRDGKYGLISNYFPWTEMANKIKFTIFRGIVSGIISKSVGRNVILKNATPAVYSGYMTLQVSE